MKNLLLIICVAGINIANAQQWVQPLSSGDYWRTEEYNRKLREFANSRNLPNAQSFPSGTVGFDYIKVNRMDGVNEIQWTTGGVTNVSRFYVEYSRDQYNFERAGEVMLARTEDGRRYVFDHTFSDPAKIYYRIAVLNANNQVVGYSPLAQVMEEEYSTKVFPTVVRGSTFHVQIGQPFQKLEVLNSANQVVYQKDIHDVTGTINIGLPPLAAGVYFVRLLSTKQAQHVQKIVVE